MPQITIRPTHGGPITLNTNQIQQTYIGDDEATYIIMSNGSRFKVKELQKDLQERINKVEGGDQNAALS